MKPQKWWLRLVFPIFLAALVAGTLLVYSSLDGELRVEQGRQQRFVRNASFEVVDNLGFELFSLYFNFSYDVYTRLPPGSPVTLEDLNLAVDRFRQNARFPRLLQDLCLVRVGPDGRPEYLVRREEGWKASVLPSWVPSFPTVAHWERSVFQSTVSLDKPVLVSVLPPLSSRPGDLVALVIRFNPAVILDEAIPSLVGQSFIEGESTSHYRVRVIQVGAGRPGAGDHSDLVVPLTPWTHFETWFDHYVARLRNLNDARIADDLPPQESRSAWWSTINSRPIFPVASGWYLAVTRIPSGINGYVEGIRLRNLAITGGFSLVLLVGFLAVFLALLQMRRLAAQEQTFTGLISHELKTPLAVIRSLSENLSQGIACEPERSQEYGAVMLEETGRLTRMIENILLVTQNRSSRSLRAPRVTMNVPVLVEATVRWYRQKHPDARIAFEVFTDVPPVRGRPEALSAVIDNLVSNAVRHGRSPDGLSRVRVTVRPWRHWGRPGVELSVADAGSGIPREDRKKLFRPFQRGTSAEDHQRPGSGVGLSLAHELIRSMGGVISVDPPGTRGTRIRIWLPKAVS